MSFSAESDTGTRSETGPVEDHSDQALLREDEQSDERH